LTRGDAVITDRYVDSSLAYQGAGRTIGVEEVARINRWGTGGLVPDLTVVLDLPADQARARLTGTPDRLEAEPSAFHEAVRQAFLDLAAREPARYVVLRADQPPDQVAIAVAAAVDSLLAARAADQASPPEHAAGGGAP
jgi:dTMP kinase